MNRPFDQENGASGTSANRTGEVFRKLVSRVQRSAVLQQSYGRRTIRRFLRVPKGSRDDARAMAQSEIEAFVSRTSIDCQIKFHSTFLI